jgi:hypothetical protein
MNKRIRKKVEKRRAREAGIHSSPNSAAEELQHAIEDFRASASHLLETVWVELQEGAVAVLQAVRAKGTGLTAQLTGSATKASRSTSYEASQQHATGAM